MSNLYRYVNGVSIDYAKIAEEARVKAELALIRYTRPGSSFLDRLAFEAAAENYQITLLRCDRALAAQKRQAKATDQK